MKFYNNFYKDGYEELISFYPRYYRNVVEMVAILKAQGRLADQMEADIEQTYLNNFILYADEPTIADWERILEITYTEKLTLEQRRLVVLGRVSGRKHIGEPEIRELIAKYTNRAVDVDFDKGVIYITIDGEVFDEANLLNTLLRRIPGHLKLDMEVRVVRTFRQALDVGFGGFTAAFRGPAGGAAKRTACLPLPLAQGGLVEPWAGSNPQAAKEDAGGLKKGAGGMFFHTRVKSKLMG